MAKRKTDKPPAATLATTATRGANEWGVPDWRDAAAYGDVTRWGFYRWRWEFYRRRDDLREYFDARAEETFRRWQPHAGKDGFPVAHLRPDEPGFCAIVDEEARARFGYSGLPNPRIGGQPYEVIAPCKTDTNISYTEGDFPDTFGRALEFAKVELDPMQEFLLSHWKERHGVRLARHEIAVTFDINKPLEAQLETARDMLRGQQALIHQKNLQKRRHPSKWLGYLRTLDARADGASWAEIAGLHPNTAQTEQTARDIWDAADALRFNF